MGNYIKDLQEKEKKLGLENLELKEKLAALEKESEPEVVDDYRIEPIEIWIGNSKVGHSKKTLPCQEAFNELCSFYDNYTRARDRNVIRETEVNNTIQNVNRATVYIEKTFRDLTTKRMVTVIKDVPMWLAVDCMVQQGQDVKLISKKKFDEFEKKLSITNIKDSAAFRKKLNEHAMLEAERQLEDKLEEEKLTKELNENS